MLFTTTTNLKLMKATVYAIMLIESLQKDSFGRKE